MMPPRAAGSNSPAPPTAGTGRSPRAAGRSGAGPCRSGRDQAGRPGRSSRGGRATGRPAGPGRPRRAGAASAGHQPCRCGRGAAVLRHPLQERPLHGHRTEDAQHELDEAVGLEGAVREQAVKADRDAQSRQDVHAQQQAQIDPVKAPVPQEEAAAAKARNGRMTAARLATHRLAESRPAGSGGGGSSATGSATGNRVISGTAALLFSFLRPGGSARRRPQGAEWQRRAGGQGVTCHGNGPHPGTDGS